MNEPQNKLSPLSVFIWVVATCVAALVVAIAALVVPVLLPNFTRVHTYQMLKASGSCINNLRQLDGAKQQYALENRATNGAVVAKPDLMPYVKLDANGNLPKCLLGGTYTIGKVGEPVTCSLGNTVTPAHVVP